MRPQAAWKVITHMRRPASPRRSSRRRFISPAALFVNVMAKISFGWTPQAATRCAIASVKTAGTAIPTAAVIAIAASYPALVAILSAPVLGEHLHWNHALAVVLIVGGVVISQL